MNNKSEPTLEREQTGSAPARRPYAALSLVVHGMAAQLTEAIPAAAAGSVAD